MCSDLGPLQKGGSHRSENGQIISNIFWPLLPLCRVATVKSSLGALRHSLQNLNLTTLLAYFYSEQKICVRLGAMRAPTFFS